MDSSSILTDDILRNAVRIACEYEDVVYEEATRDVVHTFSEDYRKKMRKLTAYANELERQSEAKTQSARTGNRRIAKKRYLLIAAIIITMASMTALAVEPIREKVIEFIEQCFSEYTEVEFEEAEKSTTKEETLPEKFEIQRLTYVPEGYVFDEEYTDETFYDYGASYLNGEGRTLFYNQVAIMYADATVTSDGTEAVPIELNGKEGYWIKDEYGWNTIFYINEEYVFILSANEEVQYLVEILIKNKII